jgi:hypothetical protein
MARLSYAKHERENRSARHEKALALMRSVETLEGTDKVGVEYLLELAVENLRSKSRQ